MNTAAWNFLEKFILLCSLIKCGTVSQTTDILALEYSRKFPSWHNTSLSPGQCVDKLTLLHGTPIYTRCQLPKRGGAVISQTRVVKRTQNVMVEDIGDVFRLVGLCNSAVASSLGLLHNGDCLAVEIAGNLTFSKKTYIRAYVEYHRESVDIKQAGKIHIPAPMWQRHIQELYSRYINYGMLEIIFVEMRFPRKNQVQRLENSNYRPKLISDWMRFSTTEVGPPRRLKVIRLSTSQKEFSIETFKKKKSSDALDTVLRYESVISHTRESIKRGHMKPPLTYGLSPYIDKVSRLKKPVDKSSWFNISKLQVDANQVLRNQRRLRKRCKKLKIPECSVTITKSMSKGLRKTQRTIHSNRIKWAKLTKTEQSKIISDVMRKLKKFRRQQGALGKVLRNQPKKRQ
ncbi:hypothetical protein FSP39_007940 [Pinctada imbricata]|uniref:Uncharacterized protein n=1 Tax=Pinctada imbricata TaxID=66713 RepID=A0AA88Y9N1_PINIB|nr:hypothetical protein FSP39_007940 [Pinctada imbricata]